MFEVNAEPLGNGRFRLSRLLRGRRGTEAAAAGHSAGEAFSLLEPESMLSILTPFAALGSRTVALAVGVGDVPEGVEAELIVTGESMRPPSPVHLKAHEQADGALVVSWVRRSRAGWSWTSGSDTPLGEERELYSVTISSGAASRTFERSEAQLVYGAAERQADGIGFPVTITVAQAGTHSASAPASLMFG